MGLNKSNLTEGVYFLDVAQKLKIISYKMKEYHFFPFYCWHFAYLFIAE